MLDGLVIYIMILALKGAPKETPYNKKDSTTAGAPLLHSYISRQLCSGVYTMVSIHTESNMEYIVAHVK